MSDRAGILSLLVLLVLGLITAPAHAHHNSSHTAVSSWYSTGSSSNPYIVFDKGTAPNGQIYAYASYGADRYRLSLKAGSGDGTTNECTTNKGWLPNGEYQGNAGYHDPGVVFQYKTGGNSEVVRGYVWYLGDKQCSSGTWRTELFIHSNGIEGTAWDGNYKSNGCIKISQLDRYSSTGDSLRPFLRSAYNRDSETVSVRS